MKWLTRFMHLRTQKSMIMWCKKQYHEAFEQYHGDQRAYPGDEALMAAGISRVQTWEAILYYLTQDEQWLE